jgi:hypothetical protein
LRALKVERFVQERLAFTASFWGSGAVVCRAVEDFAGPIVNQEFGQFETWTQAKAFAERLNEGLDLDPVEVHQILTSSILRAIDPLHAAAARRCPSDASRGAVSGKTVRVQFILAELNLAVTFCRIVLSRPSPHMPRMIRNARNALFNALDYALHSELTSSDVEEITAGCRRLHAALQESLSRRGELVTAADGPRAGS